MLFYLDFSSRDLSGRQSREKATKPLQYESQARKLEGNVWEYPACFAGGCTTFKMADFTTKRSITHHCNAKLQTATQTSRATKYSIKSTYSALLCYLKVNWGKLALINRPWKCKKGKDRRSPPVYSRKLAEHDNFTRAVSRRYRDRGQRSENPDRAKNQSDCRIRYCALLEKNRNYAYLCALWWCKQGANWTTLGYSSNCSIFGVKKL